MRKRPLLFVSAVLVQVLIAAAVPARRIYTRLTGTTIMIRTAPVDPYDFLSGYHVVLSYEISSVSGGDSIDYKTGAGTVYVVLQKDPEGVWNRTSIALQPPKDLPEGAVFMKGRLSGSRIVYGIEHYYIPEEKRGQIETALQTNSNSKILAV
jgi:uncharacterized membrane-anchored protein